MEDIDLSDRVSKLERRVAYLEGELEMSFEEQQFSHRIETIFPDDATVETRESVRGYFARVTDIDGDEAQIALDRLDNTDYGTALTETGAGLGVEVWTE
jgi:hypothetical protein